MIRSALAALTLVVAPAAAQPDLPPLAPEADVAFFGLHFIDTSTEGEINGVRADETARLALLDEAVAERFVAEGYTLADLAPVAETLEPTRNPAKCNGCAVRMAEELGADYALVGEVQKVSNLILSMNLVLRTVPEGEIVRALAVEIRSNTDESWLRGGDYILDNHIFRE